MPLRALRAVVITIAVQGDPVRSRARSVVAAIAVLVLAGGLLIGGTAQAGSEPPPCSSKLIKRGIAEATNGQHSIKIENKVCQDWYAAGQYRVDGSRLRRFAMEGDEGGVWLLASRARRATWCRPANETLPHKVKRAAC